MPRFVTPSEFVQLHPDRVDWIITNLIPAQGTVLLLGPPKEGKSFLAFDIARRVALGEPFLGYKSQPGRVLYLQFDTSESQWRRRLESLAEAGIDIHSPALMFPHPDDVPTKIDVLRPEGMEWLGNCIHSYAPTFTIIDVLREVHSADENDSTSMKRVFDVLDRVFHGRALLLIHHTRKISDNYPVDPVSLSRGSNYLTGKVDAFWLLHGGRLRIDSRFDESTLWKVRRTPEGLFYFPEVDQQILRVKQVMDLCIEFPGRSHHQIAPIAHERLGMSRATYYRYLGGRVCPHERNPSADYEAVVRFVSEHNISPTSNTDPPSDSPRRMTPPGLNSATRGLSVME